MSFVFDFDFDIELSETIRIRFAAPKSYEDQKNHIMRKLNLILLVGKVRTWSIKSLRWQSSSDCCSSGSLYVLVARHNDSKHGILATFDTSRIINCTLSWLRCFYRH